MKKRNIKKLVSCVIVGAMALSLAACGNSSDSGDAETAAASAEAEAASAEAETAEATEAGGEAESYEIVYLSPSTESEYWQYAEVGIRNAAIDLSEELGIDIEVTTTGPAAESETDAYIEAFESVIATQPDAIITATLIPEGTGPKVEEAYNQGIYVNFVSMGLEDEEYNDYFGVHYYCDNVVIGETAAQAMLDGFDAMGIEPSGVVGMHMSVVTESLEQRMQGFADYMTENAPDITLTEILYNENDVNNAQSNVETQISTYGDDLIGLYGGNNISGDGICLALQNTGEGSNILGIGVDSDSIEIEALEEGNLYAIIVQTPYQQGYDAVVNAITYLRTGENTETEKNVDCTSQVVTQANMNDEATQALLDPKILAEY